MNLTAPTTAFHIHMHNCSCMLTHICITYMQLCTPHTSYKHYAHTWERSKKCRTKGKSCILLMMLWFRRAILVWDFWTYMQRKCNLVLKELAASIHSLKHYSQMWNNLYIVECWMNKSYSIHILAIEYYLFFQNKETTAFKIIWMNIEDNKPR